MTKLISNLLLVSIAILIFIPACSEDEESPVAPATHGTISGIIIEESSHSVLANVNIFSNPATSFVTTDELGNYMIESVLPGEYTMYATQATYDTMAINISVIAGNETVADFTMKLEDSSKTQIYGSIQGTVRNKADDLPIANTAIRTSPATHSISTDSDGKFSLANIPPGEYIVFAEKTNFDATNITTTVITGLSSTTDFFLNEIDTTSEQIYGHIEGIVRNKKDDSPITSVSIRTVPVTSAISTSETGSFILSNVTPGQYTIFAEKEHFDTTSITVTVIQGLGSTADFFLSEQDTTSSKIYGNIIGKIIDAKTGNPIEDAIITTSPATSSVTSNQLGEYKVGNLNPAEYAILVSKYGYQSTTTTVNVIIGHDTNADISLTEQSTGSVAGIVRDATTGNPISGVSITTNPGTSSVTTDSLGSYTLVNLTPSDYSIMAEKTGYTSSQVSILVIAEETTTADITLQSP